MDDGLKWDIPKRLNGLFIDYSYFYIKNKKAADNRQSYIKNAYNRRAIYSTFGDSFTKPWRMTQPHIAAHNKVSLFINYIVFIVRRDYIFYRIMPTTKQISSIPAYL